MNEMFPGADGSATGWVSPYHCGLSHGPIVAMIENYRSDLIWKLLRENPRIVAGLTGTGVSGGWGRASDGLATSVRGPE